MYCSYPRTAAEYRQLAASLNASVLKLIYDGKIRVQYKILFRHLVKKRISENPNYLDEINQRVLDWYAANGNQGGLSQVIAYHHKGAVAMHGFSVQRFEYVKKFNRPLYERERSQFNYVRKTFCEMLATQHAGVLRGAGIPQSAIDRMADTGRPPEGYQVHHRLPLDDGGTNAFANLILIRDDMEHRAIHGRYNPGELAADGLQPGQSATIAHIRPPNDTVVYPNPAMGYLAERISNDHILEMLQ